MEREAPGRGKDAETGQQRRGDTESYSIIYDPRAGLGAAVGEKHQGLEDEGCKRGRQHIEAPQGHSAIPTQPPCDPYSLQGSPPVAEYPFHRPLLPPRLLASTGSLISAWTSTWIGNWTGVVAPATPLATPLCPRLAEELGGGGEAGGDQPLGISARGAGRLNAATHAPPWQQPQA